MLRLRGFARAHLGRLIAVLAAVSGLVVASAGLAAPARAQEICYIGNNDAAIDADTDCRNFVVGEQPGQRLSRADLLTHAADYEHFGFTDNFLWYSDEGATTVSSTGYRWTNCGGTYRVTPAGEFCDDWGRVVAGSLLGNFSQSPVTLSSLSFGGVSIFLACGNWGLEGNPLDRNRITAANPVPHIHASKFHDLDRDGVQDGNEGPLQGVTFRLVRESSQVGQAAGLVTTHASDTQGNVDFALDGQGPGRYYVEEAVPSGWTLTTPVRRYVNVDFGIGDDTLQAGAFGDVENTTDVAKTSFAVTGAPDHLEVGVPTPITLTSVIVNNGPAGPITVREQLQTSAPEDCRVDPATQAVDLTMDRGQQRTVTATVTLTCDRVSFHDVTFTNQVTVTTAGVQDTNPANNTATISHTWPVLGDADLGLDGLTLNCPDHTNVGQDITCTVTGGVANAGPYGPLDARIAFDLTGPDDCTITPDGETTQTVTDLPAGQTQPRTATWTVQCAHRSFHEFTASAQVSAVDQHVRDAAGNNTGSTQGTVAVFEPANLHADALAPLCTEVANPGSFDCTADITVGNDGPGTDVQATLTADLTGSEDCTITPTREQTTGLTLAAGQTVTQHYTWHVACPGPALAHTFTFTGHIAQAEPHVTDPLVDNTVTVVWSPIDIKPNSDPNSINLGRKGEISVAVLGTPTFNPFTDLNTDTLRFGRTGTEALVVRCATEPEDVNGDGIGDMTCKFNNTETGFQVGDTHGYLTGTTTTGLDYVGADAVRIIT